MTKELQFNLFVEKRGDSYVAHCMEMGIVATGVAEIEVLNKISKMTARHFGFAVANGRFRDVFKAAPNDVWERFSRAKLGVDQQTHSVRANSETVFSLNQRAYAPACQL